MIEAIALGALGGVAAGLLGIGGGILFVPALVLALDLTQVEAEATSLVAIIPVALAGTWQQRRYGNVDLRDAAILGLLSAGGVVVGVVLTHVLPERALELGFAALTLVIAGQLVRRSVVSLRDRRREREAEA